MIDWILDWARETSTVEVGSKAPLIVGLQSSGRPSFFWETNKTEVCLGRRSTCELSLRGVDIEGVVGCESCLEDAIIDKRGIWYWFKRETDGPVAAWLDGERNNNAQSKFC